MPAIHSIPYLEGESQADTLHRWARTAPLNAMPVVCVDFGGPSCLEAD